MDFITVNCAALTPREKEPIKATGVILLRPEEIEHIVPGKLYTVLRMKSGAKINCLDHHETILKQLSTSIETELRNKHQAFRLCLLNISGKIRAALDSDAKIRLAPFTKELLTDLAATLNTAFQKDMYAIGTAWEIGPDRIDLLETNIEEALDKIRDADIPVQGVMADDGEVQTLLDEITVSLKTEER